MRIEGKTLIVDEELGDEAVEEFMAAADQSEVKTIDVQNGNQSAAIVQALWCMNERKEIQIHDAFLARFFENVTVAQEG